MGTASSHTWRSNFCCSKECSRAWQPVARVLLLSASGAFLWQPLPLPSLGPQPLWLDAPVPGPSPKPNAFPKPACSLSLPLALAVHARETPFALPRPSRVLKKTRCGTEMDPCPVAASVRAAGATNYYQGPWPCKTTRQPVLLGAPADGQETECFWYAHCDGAQHTVLCNCALLRGGGDTRPCKVQAIMQVVSNYGSP